MAKARVTPLRLKTEKLIKELPRLELMAALLGARLSCTISKLLGLERLEKFFWCDSEIVLRWIINPNQKLGRYAVGPVDEILETTERNQWRYVPSDLNVADLCTKMKKFDFSCGTSTWMKGPDFLSKGESYWPEMPEKLLANDILMANNICFHKMNYSSHQLPPINCIIANDSAIDRLSETIKASWPKTVRAVARALKLFMDVFIPLVQNKQLNNHKMIDEMKRLTDNMTYLSAKDFERAEHFIFRKIQREEFPTEYAALKSHKPIKNVMMQQLRIFLDPQGIMRINARPNLNDDNYPQQYVPLLPRKNVFVRHLLASYHYKYRHVGLETQIAEIRSKAWIPQLKMAMRSIKANCNYCRLKGASPYAPPMAPLPLERINPSMRPFEVTGLDVLGPLKPTVNGNTKKIYILIFVCSLTRYIHLHLLDSLESLRVLEAIVTFWTAYGPVRKFVSDNGTNFKKTARLLEEDYQKAKVFKSQRTILGPKLSEIYRVEWDFIAVHAPWCGGMYERLIKEVKRSLATTLDRRKINRVELNIAVQEAAHRINCRPLTENSIDADDVLLTPHHLAKYKSGWPLLPGIHKETYSTVPDRSIYRRGRAVADEIMRKFTSSYLPTLTKRTKWHKDESPPRVGDLVLVIEPNKTRKEWSRGKITRIYLGKDGVARMADVVIANGKTKERRALRNLAKLILTRDLEKTVDKNSNDSHCLLTVNVNSNSTSSRNAANFRYVYTKESVIQPTENINSSILTMERDVAAAKLISNESKVVQVDGLPEEMPLSALIATFESKFKSVFGAARIFDYSQGRPTKKGLLFLHDEGEYRTAMRARHDETFLDDRKLEFPFFILSTAYMPTNIRQIEEKRIQSSPKPLGVFNLPTVRGSTTRAVLKVVQTLEKLTNLTYFRYALSETGHKTRTYGFMASSSLSDVINLIGTAHSLGDSELKLDITDSVTVLIHACDAHLINNNKRTILTPRIAAANWLCANIVDKPQAVASNSQNEAMELDAVPTDEDMLDIRNEDDLGDIFDGAGCPTETLTVSKSAPKIIVTMNSDEPSTSRASDRTSPAEKLRKTKTLPSLDRKNAKKPKKQRSSCIQVSLLAKFLFSHFFVKYLKYAKRAETIVFLERTRTSDIYLKFPGTDEAKNYKKVMSGLCERKELCHIDYCDEEGEAIISQGRTFEITPDDEEVTIFIIRGDQIFQRSFCQAWEKLKIERRPTQ